MNRYPSVHGLTLVLTLIILLLLSILITTGLQMNIMEEKMSQNMQNKELSFQAAESALLEAEQWLIQQTNPPEVLEHCTNQPCIVSLASTPKPENQSKAWWDQEAATMQTILDTIVQQPQYIIQFLRFISDSPVLNQPKTGLYYYRITTKAYGFNETAITVLQTTVAIRF